MSNLINDKSMPAILDREVSNPKQDSFGHIHFVKGLKSLIESPEKKPPFSIGLLGGWGTGKSSIKSLYLNDLEQDTSKVDGLSRKDKFHTVSFNAWRCGGEDLKRALLRHVFIELEGDKKIIDDALFKQVERFATEERSFKEFFLDIFDKWVSSFIQVFVLFILAFSFLKFFPIDSIHPGALSVISIAVMASLTLSVKYLLNAQRFLVSTTKSVRKLELPQTTVEQYESLLLDQIIEFKKKISPKCQRIVVFIDDLDRLSSEEMVSGLDAVRAFMELSPSDLPEDMGIIFVISCDEQRVARAIYSRGYRGVGNELPATVFSQLDARRYLDRIFQFRMEIPKFPSQDMRLFAINKLENSYPELIAILKKKKIPIDNVIDRLIHTGVESPRNAIQILNAFMQSWWIASNREVEAIGSDRSGGLVTGTVTDHPITLAILSALKVDFPDFFIDLQEDPELIKRVDLVVFRENDINEQPLTTRKLLKKYITDKHDFKNDHSLLRQFLASIRAHRWPSTIKPLLMLTQDPLTRKLGDRVIKLRDAFVSGDTIGVLSELGREIDNRFLDEKQIRLLRDLEQGLYNDTEIHNNNAGFVLSELVYRLPEAHAHFLMSPLARKLSESEELRWRVTIPKIEKVLNFAEAQDRRDVAAALIDDLLKLEGDINFRLSTGETPSIGEAEDMVTKAAEITLWIRKEDQLDPDSDRTFIEWLKNRRFSVKGKENFIPYLNLEHWMENHESHLLQDFGVDYSNLLISQFESDDDVLFEIDKEKTIARLSKVLDSLLKTGEESRPIVWEIIQRACSVQGIELIDFSINYLIQNIEYAQQPYFSEILTNLGERISSETKGWAIEDREVYERFNQILSLSTTLIDKNAHEILKTIGTNWVDYEGFGPLCCNFMDNIVRIDLGLSNEILNVWSTEISTTLPLECISWISKNYLSVLNNDIKAQLLNGFDSISKGGDIPDDIIKRFKIFLKDIPNEQFQQQPLKKFFNSILEIIPNYHSDQNKYLTKIFIILPKYLYLLPNQSVGPMLNGLFVNAISLPEVYGFIHENMKNYWPKPDETLAPYNPDSLFNAGEKFLKQQPSLESAISILESLLSMVSGSVVDEEKFSNIIELALLLWPNHINGTADILLENVNKLSSDQVIKLLEYINIEDRNQIELLTRIWEKFSKGSSVEEVENCLRLILQEGISKNGENGDVWLSVWFDVFQGGIKEIIPKVMLDVSITEDQKIRVWIQIEKRITISESNMIQGLVPQIFKFECTNLQDKIMESLSLQPDKIKSHENRYSMSEMILKSFLNSVYLEHKKELASILRKLKGESLIKKLEGYGEYSMEDINILISAFPEQKKVLKDFIENEEKQVVS
jgi:hypothetical protein